MDYVTSMASGGEEGERRRFVVVGGGIAGVSCAEEVSYSPCCGGCSSKLLSVLLSLSAVGSLVARDTSLRHIRLSSHKGSH